MSKVKDALQLVAQGMNTHAAAIQAGAAPTHVYKAIKRARDREAGICTCCGQALDRTVKDVYGEIQAVIDTLEGSLHIHTQAEQYMIKQTCYALRTITGEIKALASRGDPKNPVNPLEYPKPTATVVTIEEPVIAGQYVK